MKQFSWLTVFLFSLTICVTIGSVQGALPDCLADSPAASLSEHLAYTPNAPLATTRIITCLPWVTNASHCPPIEGAHYESLSVPPPPTDRPAEVHADLNLSLRSYAWTAGFAGLVDYAGSADPAAPQLPCLFADQRTPGFSATYQVYDWNWGCNCRGAIITSPPVTLLGILTTPGEIIHTPASGYTIGDGYTVLVLYADEELITIKYTREDNVIYGYTVHIENVCVEPSLLALYQNCNIAGRANLPALRQGQALGRALTDEIRVAIRDNGSFLDPRSRKDWWQGR